MAESIATNQNIAQVPNNQGFPGSIGVGGNYTVRLTVTGDRTLGKDRVTFEAMLPERYTVGLTSSWNTPFAKATLSELANMGFGPAAGVAVQSAGQVLGISEKTMASAMQVWDSTSPMSFGFDMIFMAYNNSIQDVQEKHRLLLKLAAPSSFNGILSAPGPTPIGQALGGRSIMLEIGNYLILKNVVIKGVSADLTTMCDAQGIPISATIHVDVESFYSCFTVQDIDAMFVYSPEGVRQTPVGDT